MTPAPTQVEMLSELSACAYRLGVAFAAEAEAASDWPRKLELFRLFDHCFFSFRVAVALELRLGREARRDPARAADGADAERDVRPEVDRAEAAERPEAYDKRDRETERATLPLLISTLQGVAADAAALPGPPPAALPTLRELLARLGAEPGAPPRPAARPQPPPRRTYLAGASTAAVAALIQPRPAAHAVRRATGPP